VSCWPTRSPAASLAWRLVRLAGRRLTAAGFRKMLSTVGATCGLPHAHPHMLRHSCGFYMADRSQDVRVMQDWLGHANVQNTVRSTALAQGRLAKAKAPG